MSAAAEARPLDQLMVLDLSDSIAGQYCCRLFADYGATVVLVEPSGGSPIRRMPPFGPDGQQSLLFRHLNAGKRSVVLGAGDVEQLMRQADAICVGRTHDGPALAEAHPKAVVASITDFGRDGPLADWQGSELIHQALSSVMLANGLRDRAPLYGCGHRASYAAGVAAYAGMLAALFERQASGKGQHLDVSVAETAATMSTAPTAFAYSGRLDSGRGHSDSFINCRGEWVLIWIYPVQWPDFCAALDLGALVEDPRFADKDTRQANWREFIALLQSRFGDTPADDVVGRLQARRLITAKAASLTGLLAQDAHLASRQFWQQQDGALRLRPPFVFDAADDR